MNKSSVKRLIGAVFFFAILPVLGHALTPGEVFNKVKDSVVVVKTLDAQGKVISQGSGVLLPSESKMDAQTSSAGEEWLRREAKAGRHLKPVTDPELLAILEADDPPSGRVATNCHVVEGGSSYQVGRGKQFVSATLYAEDGGKDICLLDAKGIDGKPAQLGKATDLKVGDVVYAVGAPKGLELSLSDGIVAQLRGGPSPFIQTTAAISPGSSGGGLFDREGRLVGLTTFFLDGGQSLNFAMPVEWISEVKPGRKLAAEGHGQTEWLKRAIALGIRKDWQGLLNWCRKWTKNEPKDADAWFGLGNAYGHLNRHNDAIEAYRQALRINPEYAGAWYNLGYTYGDLNRHNDAIEAYRQALRINPEYSEAWGNLGYTYLDLNRHNDAIEAYRQALRINPEHALSWYGLGKAYDGLKRYDYAIEAYCQVLRIDPEDANVWNSLGLVYFISGNRTAALNTVKELRRLDPAKADELFNLIVPR